MGHWFPDMSLDQLKECERVSKPPKPAGLATYKTRLNTGRSVIVIVGPHKLVTDFRVAYEAAHPTSRPKYEEHDYEDGMSHVELYIPEDAE